MSNKTQIFNKIKELINNGSSVTQAISVVCQQYNINPNIIYNEFYKKADKTVKDDTESLDKIRVGDIVTLDGDSLEKHYEVININNKSDIILRNADDNTQLSASESEITPVITENKMNKLNEAQYNISINGLETEDADALSQMLSLASQAENNSTISDPLTANPMGMNMNDDMSSSDSIIDEPNMGEEPMSIGMPSSIFDDSGDDIEFDEELPADTAIVDSPELNSEENEQPEMNDNMDSSIEDMPMDSMMDDGMYDEVDEDVVLDPSQKDSTVVANEKNNFDDELDEELEMLMRETFDIAGVEDLNFDKKLNEAEENVPGEDFIDEDGTLEETPQLDFAHDMVDDAEQDEYAEEIVGEADGDDIEDWQYDEYQDDVALANGSYGNVDEFMSDYFYDNAELQSEFDSDLLEEYKNEIFEKWQELIKDGENEWEAAEMAANEVLPNSDDKDVAKRWDAQNLWDDELDEHINAILRNAGVQINEADDEVAVNTNVGEPVTDESLFANNDTDEQGNEPDYHEVDTTTFGKDASEGMKENPLTMTFESTINKKKIKSIYETAKSMYKKYDSADWLKLDRRYIEKLILEGVGYTTASKMLLDAKKGK